MWHVNLRTVLVVVVVVVTSHQSEQSEQSLDRESDLVADIQKLVGGMPDGVDGMNTSHDHDRDKYKRRPAFQWLTRWFRYIAFFNC